MLALAEKTDRKAGDLALVALASLAVATSSPLAKEATGISSIGLAAGRCLVASLILLAILPRPIFRALAALDGRTRWKLVGVGALLAAHFGLFLAGLRATSLPAAVALVSLEPLAVVLVGWAAFGLVPSRLEWIGIGIATAGAVAVSFGEGKGEHHLSGDIMVLVAAALFGMYVMAARGLKDKLPPLPYAASVYGTAGLLLLPLALVLGWGEEPPPLSAWGIVLGLAVVPTLVGHTLIQRLSRRVSPSVVALVSPGETVGSIAIGVMLGRQPSIEEGIGTGLVIVGAVVAAMEGRRSG